jgi:hypothetical protein
LMISVPNNFSRLSDSSTMVFCTSSHTMPRRVPSSDYPDNCFVRELSIRRTLIPTTTMFKGTSSQHIFQNLICPLSLSVGLRVIGWAKVQLCIHGLMKLLPKMRCELGTSVRHYLLRHTMHARSLTCTTQLALPPYKWYAPVWSERPLW